MDIDTSRSNSTPERRTVMAEYPKKNATTRADVIAALAERAERLWGAERAEAAGANIEEAAEYVWLIGGHPPQDDEAPLFHPQPPNSRHSNSRH